MWGNCELHLRISISGTQSRPLFPFLGFRLPYNLGSRLDTRMAFHDGSAISRFGAVHVGTSETWTLSTLLPLFGFQRVVPLCHMHPIQRKRVPFCPRLLRKETPTTESMSCSSEVRADPNNLVNPPIEEQEGASQNVLAQHPLPPVAQNRSEMWH